MCARRPELVDVEIGLQRKPGLITVVVRRHGEPHGSGSWMTPAYRSEKEPQAALWRDSNAPEHPLLVRRP
jgi:hypothetical protein